LKLARRVTLVLSIAATLLFPVAVPAMASAAEGIQENLCAGANLDVNTNCDSGGITDQQAKDRINNILRTVIRLFSIVVGVASVVMIIIGGLKYITSGGDSGNVSGAKNTILYAIIGIVVVALAQFIVRFVLTQINQ
jgi:hypothetical protein